MRGEPSSTQAVDEPDLALSTCVPCFGFEADISSVAKLRGLSPRKSPKEAFAMALCMSQRPAALRVPRMSTDSTICHTVLAAATTKLRMIPLVKLADIVPWHFCEYSARGMLKLELLTSLICTCWPPSEASFYKVARRAACK